MPNRDADNRASSSSSDESSRQRSVRYPRHNLVKAEEFARVVFDLGARNCDVDKVAQGAGYKSAQNGAFAALRGSASTFGLIKSSGGYLSVSEHWIEAFNSEDDEQLKKVRRSTIQRPALYRQLLSEYADRQLPNLERLARELYLNQKYGILKEAAAQAAQVFFDSASYAGVIDSKGYLRFSEDIQPALDTTELERETDFSLQGSPSISARNPLPRGISNTFLPDEEELDRIEIKLLNGSKAYLFVPVPLPFGEKERIKKYIDLLLEEQPPNG